MPLPAISWGSRFLLPPRCDFYLIQARTFIEARVPWVRDRGLDHAVEKEKHLLAFHSLKNFLLHYTPSSISSPTGVSLDAISERREELRLPFRAIRFIRLFPHAFVEETPGSSADTFSPPRPFIRPTANVLRVHSDELRAFESSRSDAADRLLRLLMLSPHRRLPLSLIDRLRWDLGLPCDYVRSLLPDFPDYFQISPSGNGDKLDIELVCYRKDLAISAMEHYAMRTGGYQKGASLAFPLHFSRGFVLEKKVRKWLDDWQKLPYISPYESGLNLPPKSDYAEKWTVGVVHEVLNLLIGKKTEKDNLILLGQHLGLPPGLRKMIANHPGIFYLSNKLRTHTVVLREAYKRDLLVEKHPLMGIRYQYIHIMHKKETIGGKKKNRKSRRVSRLVDDVEVDEKEDEDAVEVEDVDDRYQGESDYESVDQESSDDEVTDAHLSLDIQQIEPRISRPITLSSIESQLVTCKTTRRTIVQKSGLQRIRGANRWTHA